MLKTSLVLLSLIRSSDILHHLLFLFFCFFCIFARSADDDSLTVGVIECEEDGGCGVSSLSGASNGVGESVWRGADVGATGLRRDDNDNEERDESDDEDGESNPREVTDEGSGDRENIEDSLLLVVEDLTEVCAESFGLCIAEGIGLPVMLYTPSVPKECGVEKGAAETCRLKVS
jgi:hypothetical protein